MTQAIHVNLYTKTILLKHMQCIDIFPIVNNISIRDCSGDTIFKNNVQCSNTYIRSTWFQKNNYRSYVYLSVILCIIFFIHIFVNISRRLYAITKLNQLFIDQMCTKRYFLISRYQSNFHLTS